MAEEIKEEAIDSLKTRSPELTIEELESHLTTDSKKVDKLKAKRIIERISYMCDEIKLISKNNHTHIHLLGNHLFLMYLIQINLHLLKHFYIRF